MVVWVVQVEVPCVAQADVVPGKGLGGVVWCGVVVVMVVVVVCVEQECEKSGVVAADSAKYLCCRGYAAAKHAHIKRLHVNRDVYTTKLNKERTRSIECQRNHCLEGGSLCNR